MNFSDFQEILGLAANAVGLTKQAASTAGEVKKLFSDGDSAASAETQELLNTLAHQLTTANMTNFQLSALLKEISERVRAEDEYEKRKKRYRLVDTGHGDMVLVFQPEGPDDDPQHFICPICLEKLRKFHYVTGSPSSDGKHCQNCRHYFKFRQTSLPRNSGGAFM